MSIRNLIISTGAFLALGAVAIGFASSLLLGIEVKIDFLSILFLTTLSVYIVNRSMDVEEDTYNQLERVRFMERYKNLVLLLGVLTYTVAIIIASEKGLKIVAATCIPVIIGLTYTIRWVPNGFVKKLGFSRLKDILLLKNIVVAGIWAYSVPLFLVYYYHPISLSAIALFTFIFLRCFINTLIFDIRDVVGDNKMSIKTLPLVFGVQRTKNALILLNMFSFILAIVFVHFALLPSSFVFTSLVALPAHFIIAKSNPHNKSMENLCDIYEDANETYVLLALTLLGYFLLA